MQNDNSYGLGGVSRRDFLKNSSVLVASAAAAVSFPAILHAQENRAINAVVIGVGGRGSGAGANFLEAAKAAGVQGKIVAVADLFPDAARRGTEHFGVPADKCFSGFDAFQKALAEPGVNYVILAEPPGFRAPHFKAAVEAGKNVFMEKPVAVDGPGCRIMYAAGEMAKQKGLKVAAGTQRRHQASYRETIQRIHDGAIGDILTLRAYWVNGGPIWHRGDRGDSQLEKQIRNWYHYIWLSGDHICEQHVHNIDVCNWVMKDHPVKCWGMGSRQQLGERSGEIWDNFSIEFQYANGSRMYSYCGQIKRDWASVSEGVQGSQGTANPANTIIPKNSGGKPSEIKEVETVHHGFVPHPDERGARKLMSGFATPKPAPIVPKPENKSESQMWRFRGQNTDPYVQEHIDLINAIVKGTELNEAKQVTDSTLTAIMGREAAYSGAEVSWDEILNSPFMYGPEALYKDAGSMTWGDFRVLQPPMPGSHNILKNPPEVPVKG